MARQPDSPTSGLDPLWYKDAIIYEVHVRAFHDSDGDGIGDFRGLAQKLDYLQDLGVTAIWLLPFYPSPLKDDGYDIANYTDIHPSYGAMQDFRYFLREARDRGIQVITELVLNHTSDQHPWFQRARRAPRGSSHRNFYVWSDTAQEYADARIIFKDFETSNWAWDPLAGQYYWHRFYSHQPDLNFKSAELRRSLRRVLDFWLGMGVSGLRLDAVPYLYEREGTNCENLPETHQVIKQLRKHVDERFPNRMLLAEANQWAEDAVAYFGDGDECHMCFNFPLMPRLFMSLRMEDRFPVLDVLQELPAIPESTQWALFLRNHDELTLEMVTDEERDYMYRVYAHDRTARINLGIRRRLAPQLNNDRRKIELLNALLLSLPGTPVIYYGDEIGMGDNFYLGDRNGVRTPMQWSADRNAGFSRANAQKLYMPVIIDPEYHYEAVNVDVQQANPDSLLWWMKRMIALRKRFKAFGRGEMEVLQPENRKVLAFLRSFDDETVLVVANLSRQAQHVSLDLRGFVDSVPLELSGGQRFPAVTEAPYSLSLSPYGFYWFSLTPRGAVPAAPGALSPVEMVVPNLPIRGEWTDLLDRDVRPIISNVLLGYLRKCRWFGGKARIVQTLTITDVVPIADANFDASFVFTHVDYTEGESETYVLPLSAAFGEAAEAVVERFPHALIARLETITRGQSSSGVLYDALFDPVFTSSLLTGIARRQRYRGETGEVVAAPTAAFRRLRGPLGETLEPRPLGVDQTNTSIAFDERLALKVFRRLGEGVNPDLEISRFLTERTRFTNAPAAAGYLEYRIGRTSEPMTIAILQEYVPNQGDAWTYTLDALGRYFEQVLAYQEADIPAPAGETLLALSRRHLPEIAYEAVGHYLASAFTLGQRTAELHLALASDERDPDFSPEPFSAIYQRSLYANMRSLDRQALQLLRSEAAALPQDVGQDAQRVLSQEAAILDRLQAVRRSRIHAQRVRIHGDYHLGQVLYTGRDFVIIDFEGEPSRALSERRLKRSPLRDVAGMLRSFHYASRAAFAGLLPTVLRPEDLPRLERWAYLWYQWVSVSFLQGYMSIEQVHRLLPQDYQELDLLLNAYLLEKALYEVGYELNNRPDWVGVPLQGILQILEAAT